ncbi:MAG: ATP-binding cassette domain-containing protein, partial [Ignavibacteriae bacterium]|nr:ATP-binding cassette domain-containing protein [Ignavibacteriota bacterium]
MLSTSNIALRFGKRTLFEEVNLKFTPGNCYGIIGANGSGKSTFIKILSGEIEPSSGNVIISPGERLATLKQDQFEYDEYQVLQTVMMGHKKLFAIMEERDALYSKPDFNEKDGIRAAILEGEFAELSGYEAESEAGELLDGLGINAEQQTKLMKDLS